MEVVVKNWLMETDGLHQLICVITHVDAKTHIAKVAPRVIPDIFAVVENNATPTLSGRGKPGATVEAAAGNQKYTATVGPDGSWNLVIANGLSK
jgi:hypothetical protein